MAATAWEWFTEAKGKLGEGTFDFTTAGAYKVSFHKSTTALSDGSNVSTMAELSTLAPRHASTNNLSLNGFTLSSNAWFVSGSGYGFCSNGICVSANGAAFQSIAYAVIRLSTATDSGRPIMFSRLTTAPNVVSVADTNALKINGGKVTSTKIFNLV